MAYTKQVYDEAKRELQSRRRRAEWEQEERHRTLAQTNPEILRIEREMAEAGLGVVKALGRGVDGAKIIEELARQSLNAQAQRKELLRAAGHAADYLEIQYTCPACRDTGFVDGRICPCHKALLRQIAYRRLSKNSPLQLCRFESFDLSFYPDTKDAQTGVSPRRRMAEIYEYCKGYAADFDTRSPSLLFCGATGLGKTHLSLAIAGKAIEQGFGVVYGSTQNLMTQMENERFGRSENPGGTTEQMLLDCDLLLLDDLGAEFSTQFTVAAVYNIVNTRMLSGLPVIISTNLTAAQLEEKYTQRITSRILGSYHCLLFCGRDVRQVKRMGGLSQ